ncbi:MAG: hypothetical protein AB1772_04550 [Candidatus Zixiibacteriota bacterium]
MRFIKSLLPAGTTVSLTVFLALGCSDDKKLTPPTPPEDHGIESMLGLIQSQVHEYLDSAAAAMEAGLEVATFIDVDYTDIGDAFMGPGLPDSTVDQRRWIVSYLTDLSSGTGTLSIIDSLAYVVNGNLSINARGAQAMYVKHNYGFVSDDTTVTFTDRTNRGDLHITGIDGTTATINGEFQVTIRDKFVASDSTVWNNWIINSTVSELAFTRTGLTWTTGCPNSGTCTVNVEYQYGRNEDIPTTTEWQFDITFTDGTIAADVAVGQLRTSYDYTLCTP